MTDTHLRNAFRYDDQPRWFDFYNCRIVVPDQGLFFFAVPYVLSGAEVPEEIRGLYMYDSGNGAPTPGSHVAVERIGVDNWTASRTCCDFRWQKPGHEANFFSEHHIRFTGPTSHWDVQIRPFLGDRENPLTDSHRFNLEERIMLKHVPFIHRVPRMKAYADGLIEQAGRRHELKQAVVYQAKNHGVGFPDAWNWIHANAFREDEELAFEAAWLTSSSGPAALLRVVRPGSTRVLASWLGDDLDFSQCNDDYTIRAVSRDGSMEISGHAIHRENVVFTFPSPEGGQLVNDESLVGELSVAIAGKRFTTSLAALGRAHCAPLAQGQHTF